ncbi:hypothetical protein AB0B07_21410 [Streptomyces sioyaensis]|uniref:hypothetical protein n=1 Tax=Streptomyces sioyaensis TaxID=67364 RepID=UPI0033EB7834
MSLEPDAEQAARALEDVQHRRHQAIAAQREPRWFFLAWGAVLFLTFSTPDLLPLLHLERWSMWWMAVLGPLTVVFLLGQYTRRGRSLFGLPPGLKPRAFLPAGAPGSAGRRYPWAGFLVVVGVVGILSVGSAWLLSMPAADRPGCPVEAAQSATPRNARTLSIGIRTRSIPGTPLRSAYSAARSSPM